MHSRLRGPIRWLAIAALGAAQAVFAQGAKNYPDKPVRVVVGYSPGGLPDTIARLIGQKLSERWGQQFVVENKPGANGILGAEFVAKAAPDGDTLLMTDNSTHASIPVLYAQLPYDADRDLIPASLTARAPLFLAARPSVKPCSFRDLIALTTASPRRFRADLRPVRAQRNAARDHREDRCRRGAGGEAPRHRRAHEEPRHRAHRSSGRGMGEAAESGRRALLEGREDLRGQGGVS